ncbi:MAG: L-serine ammonia-lyase, partial [Rickettsiales bacterium]|nr:L-serine ammonia-lyase [Rickettsiales bacterium]
MKNEMISVFDIFKVCIGPSSSHTVGPMKAAFFFVEELHRKNRLNDVEKIEVDLYGSLALTKTGHGTDIAIQLGLAGFSPKTVDSEKIGEIIRNIRTSGKIKILNIKSINFSSAKHIVAHKTEALPYHPNGIIITAFDSGGGVIHSEEYYSVGGGFVEIKSEIVSMNGLKTVGGDAEGTRFPNNFNRWSDLEKFCKKKKSDVWEIILENERVFRTDREIDRKVGEIYSIMKNCMKSGLHRRGNISGGLGLKRRSHSLEKSMKRNALRHFEIIDILLLGGMAASEENASYGKIISAPTNGSAGVIPAVIKYYKEFYNVTFADFKKFILTAGAVGILCKKNASLSGAEGGCQAEIGVATAMAASGLCAALGGTVEQCENAAIIAMTHSLGLVCDPIGGLVQIPCIERNPISAVKAVTACRLAMLEKKSNYL